jgi:hypothetical protein
MWKVFRDLRLLRWGVFRLFPFVGWHPANWYRDSSFSETDVALPPSSRPKCRWRRISPKRWYLPRRLHGVTSQKDHNCTSVPSYVTHLIKLRKYHIGYDTMDIWIINSWEAHSASYSSGTAARSIARGVVRPAQGAECKGQSTGWQNGIFWMNEIDFLYPDFKL